MTRQISTPFDREPGVTWHGISLEEREAMIRETAYHRYARRGYAHGFHLDDWLVAETELAHGATGEEALPIAQSELQQSSVHGAREDDDLKRIIKQHPHRAIPQVESIESREAPSKQ